MSAVTAWPTLHSFTVDDLADMPDDGKRYELIDGVLLVSPSPTFGHQRASSRLAILLAQACPSGLEVFFAPLDIRLSEDTLVQPDLVVLDQVGIEEHGHEILPRLAVEILSPSTRLIDLNLKKARYEVAGCPSYWAVDPGLRGGEASITAWELREGSYVEVGRATGEEAFHTHVPFDVTIVPSALATPVTRKPPTMPLEHDL